MSCPVVLTAKIQPSQCSKSTIILNNTTNEKLNQATLKHKGPIYKSLCSRLLLFFIQVQGVLYCLMNWITKVDERTKQKIELLYRQFDKFIEDNHSTSSNQDAGILKQWVNFKQVIEKNPTDFESMHQYLNKLSQEEKRLSKQGKESRQAGRKSSGVMTMDAYKLRLKKMSTEIVTLIGKNNKDLFRG